MIAWLSLLLAAQTMDEVGLSEFWRFNCLVSGEQDSGPPRRVDAIYFIPKDTDGYDRFDFRDPTKILNRPEGWAPDGIWLVTANELPANLTAWLGSDRMPAEKNPRKHIDSVFAIALPSDDQKSATLKLTDFRAASPGRVTQVIYSGDCAVETGPEAFKAYFEVQK